MCGLHMRTYKSIEENNDEILFEIECGSIFIYPTDTIYGIGCNALDSFAVRGIRRIKKSNKPFSVIAPSMRWIYENCIVEKKDERYLKKLPGKHTLIFKLKSKNAVCRETNLNSGTVGVRIPKHWISKIVEKLGFPIITTSLNISGERYLTDLKELNKKLEKQIDFAIDEGPLEGKPSKVIDLVTGKVLKNSF